MSLFHLIFEVLLAMAVLSGGTCLAGIFWLRRRNRVCPGVATDAPLLWLISPRRAASGHRRLRRSVLAARAALGAYEGRGGAGTDIGSVVTELGRHAARIDAELVVVARCPAGQRRRVERALLQEVRDVEQLAVRLVASLVETSPAPIADMGHRLSDRLDALEAAHAELAEIEARVMVSSAGRARA